MWFLFFFFQAEDGIRDGRVTGVQTCALPISRGSARASAACQWAACPAPAVPGAFRALFWAGCPAACRAASPGIGRAACRGRGEVLGGGAKFKKKKKQANMRAG